MDAPLVHPRYASRDRQEGPQNRLAGRLALPGIRSLIGLLGRVQAEIGIDPVGRAPGEPRFQTPYHNILIYHSQI
jgi:hypothetical protein